MHGLLVLSVCAFCATNAFSNGAMGSCSSDGTSPTNKCGHNQKIEPRKESVVVTVTFAPVPVNEIDRSVSVIDTREKPLLYNHWTD
ncbi:MAG: hypothetical protein ACRD2S_09805, partial [Terriglobales bacterium]